MWITQENVKKLRNSVLLLISIYAMIGASLFVLQERLLFLPTVLEENYQYEFQVPFKELNFHPEPGVRLNALLFKAAEPKGLIFYSHGNAGDLSRWGDIASEFVAYHYDVLVWDYRSYGKSRGPISEKVFYSDAQYVFDQVSSAYPPKNIIVYGRSLGTAITSYLGSRNEVGRVILETPFYSITDVAQRRFPIFPVKRLMKYHFPNYEFIPQIEAPLTLIHGTEDSVVPYESARKLMEAAHGQMRFISIEGGDHNNLADFRAFNELIEQLLQ